MNDSVFNAYGKYYDLLYRDKNYEEEVAYIANLFAKHRMTGQDILELGSGTGIHGRIFAERGFQVTGIERSAEMVAKAKLVQGFISHQGDISSVQLGRTFSAVISLFHVLSYQTTNEGITSVFARAAEHLTPGGLFLFDIWYSPAVYTQRPEVRIKRMADEMTDITRIAEPKIYPNENRVDVQYNIFAHNIESGVINTFTETHSMRHFSLPELDMLAEVSGFERVNAEEFMTGATPSDVTWGVCIVLKKV